MNKTPGARRRADAARFRRRGLWRLEGSTRSPASERRPPPRTATSRRRRRGGRDLDRAEHRCFRRLFSFARILGLGRSASARVQSLPQRFRGHDRRERRSRFAAIPGGDAGLSQVSSGRWSSCLDARPAGRRGEGDAELRRLHAQGRRAELPRPERPGTVPVRQHQQARSHRAALPERLQDPVSRSSRRSGRESCSGSNERAQARVSAPAHARAGRWRCGARPRRGGMRRRRQGTVGREPWNGTDVDQRRREHVQVSAPEAGPSRTPIRRRAAAAARCRWWVAASSS